MFLIMVSKHFNCSLGPEGTLLEKEKNRKGQNMFGEGKLFV